MTMSRTEEAASGPPYTVLLVEDDEATRHYIASAVTRHPSLRLSASCADLASARQALLTAAPNVLLTDLALPDGDGVDLIREVKARTPDCECMVISVFGTESRVLGALAAGATGYLLKDESNQRIGDAVMSLIGGGSPMRPNIARHLLDGWHGQPSMEGIGMSLTEREISILSGLSKGYTYHELATQLNLSQHTVGTHVKNIYRKLEVCSRAEAVYEAVQLGLIRIS